MFRGSIFQIERDRNVGNTDLSQPLHEIGRQVEILRTSCRITVLDDFSGVAARIACAKACAIPAKLR
jgi:hypothetical protein